MLKIENISHSYGDQSALENVSFEVGKGELFGLLGPDGAGKTSLFRILTTLLLPTEGRAFFDGRNVVEDYQYVRSHVGYMPGRFSLYQDLSVRENLEFFASVMNADIEENRYLIDDIYKQLEPFEKRRAGALSGGMKQKLALSCALIHKPLMLFLDEPTTGVDAVSRVEFWEMLKSLKKENISILVSTPYMDEAAYCDRVALIQDGRILDINTPEKVVSNFSKAVYEVRSGSLYKTLEDLREFSTEIDVYPFGESLHVYGEKSELVEEILKEFSSTQNIEFNKVEADIEDVFMILMTEKAHG